MLRVSVGWIAVLLGVLVQTLFSADKRPNVVFVLTDDQRWDTISLNERSPVKTPHIDRLGKEGVYFRNAFCTTSLCSPSRASILSGLYAHSHGVQNNFTEYPNDLPSFPRALQAAGYATGYIGKYHMGEENDEKRPGFDYFVTHKGQGKYFDTEFNVDGERKVLPGYYTHVVTDLAEKWIRKSAARRQAVFVDARPQSAAQLLFSGAEIRACVRQRRDSVSAESAFQLAGQAEVVSRPARHLARHLWAAVRVSQAVSRPPAGGGEGFCGDDARLLGHDPLGR